VAAQQMLCVRSASEQGREVAFGHYMVAVSIGQGLGPLLVGWVGGGVTVPATAPLFMVGVIMAALCVGVALAIRPAPQQAERSDAPAVPLAELLRRPGMSAVLIASVVTVTAGDLLVIYLPLLGAERNIEASHIGLLLTVRAAAALVARVFYARLIQAVGRLPLTVVSTLVGAAAFALMVLIVRLDETVVGKFVPFAICQKLFVGAKNMRLVAQQIDNLHGRTSLIVIIKLGSFPGLHHSVVHAEIGHFYLKGVHADAAEGCTVVRKGAVTYGGTGDGSKPAVEDREVARERRKHRQFVGLEIVHDLAGMFDIPPLIEIALYKTLHRWSCRRTGRAKVQLLVDRDEMMIGIGVELALELSERRDFSGLVGGIRIRLVAGKPINSRIFRL